MGASVNKVILLGRLGAAPDLRHVGGDDRTVVNFSVATDSRWKAGDERKSETQWTRVVAWGKLAELCAKLVKGQQVYVEGRLRTSSYTPAGAEKPVYSTEVVAAEVVFLAKPGKPTTEKPSDDLPDREFTEDDLPF